MQESQQILKDVRKVVAKDVSRLRSEVRKIRKDFTTKLLSDKVTTKAINPFTGLVSGNYWTQTGMPWANSEGRKAVLTEWFWQPIRGQPRRVDTNELRQFSQSFWVNACISTILDEVTSLDWDIVAKEGYNYEEVEKAIYEAKAFLKHPNKNRETFTEIIRAVLKDIYELDAGVIVKVYSVDSYDFEQLEPKSGSPLLKERGQRKLMELYARDGASFLKEADKFGFENGYWQYSYQIPAHPMWFNKAEIAYFMRNTRSMSVYGYSPVQAIIDIVKSLHYSTLYNKRFFEETPIPDGALGLLDTNETEMKAFVDWWQTEFKGQPHKLAVINKDIKWQPFNISQRELEFLDTQKWYFRLVISMFGLTPTELGLTEDVNKATSESQTELSKRKGIRPLLKIVENFINEDIIPELGYEGIEFAYIYDDPQEKKSRLENWQLELNMGVKTINEVREEMGLEPVAYGDTPRMSMFGSAFGGQPSSGEGFGNEEGGFPSATEASSEGRQSKENPKEENKKPVKKEFDKKEGKKKETEEDDEEEDEDREETEEGQDEDNDPMTSKKDEKKEDDVAGDGIVSDAETTNQYAREADQHDMQRRDEADTGVARATLDPYNLSRRPVGSFKQKKKNKLGKGVDDGQYYHEPNYIIQQPRGLIDQIGPRPDYRSPNQFMDSSTLDTVNCPMCGNPTLSLFQSQEDLGNLARYRCTSCAHIFDAWELMDNQTLATMFNTMQQNPITQPITIPEWSPKSFDDFDLLLDTKEYCGFDYIKTPQTFEYVNSIEYKKLLSQYLSDLSKEEVQKIIKEIAEGLRQKKTMNEISEKIKKIIPDGERAKRIARTEVIRVTNEGRRREYDQMGFKQVEWIASRGKRTCPICKAQDGKTFKISEAKNLIPAHVGCRCTFAAVV